MVFVANSFVTKISIPLVFFNVTEAMYPLLDSSAATKYSPDTPAKIPEIFLKLLFDYELEELLVKTHEKEYLKAMLHPQKTWGWTGMAAIRGKGSLDAHFYLSHSSLQPVAFQPIDRLKSDTHG